MCTAWSTNGRDLCKCDELPAVCVVAGSERVRESCASDGGSDSAESVLVGERGWSL